MIHEEIEQYGGDIQKFAGDAILAEWKVNTFDKKNKKNMNNCTFDPHVQAVLLATACATRLVDKCADFLVQPSKSSSRTTTSSITTIKRTPSRRSRVPIKPPKTMYLNIHCAIGYGTIVQTHVGTSERRELLLLGDAIQQVTQTIDTALDGQVITSNQAMEVLKSVITMTGLCSLDDVMMFQSGGSGGGCSNTTQEATAAAQVLADKDDPHYFINDDKEFHALLKSMKEQATVANSITTTENNKSIITDTCNDWPLERLEHLHQGLASYVHPVVVADEMASAVSNRFKTGQTTTTNNQLFAESEVRDVFTMFVNPIIKDMDWSKTNIERDQELLEKLQQLMVICNSEVTRFHGQLRQFVMDDKGLIMIANFGCRGSVIPNL